MSLQVACGHLQGPTPPADYAPSLRSPWRAAFAGRHFTAEDTREDYSEPRYITVGKMDGRMVVVVWTPRGEARRIISMRKANEREQARYAHRVD